MLDTIFLVVVALVTIAIGIIGYGLFTGKISAISKQSR